MLDHSYSFIVCKSVLRLESSSKVFTDDFSFSCMGYCFSRFFLLNSRCRSTLDKELYEPKSAQILEHPKDYFVILETERQLVML